jgi:hypothetical protein
MRETFQISSAGLPLRISMLLCFSLMGIYWVRIAQLGAFSLEAYHLGLLFIIMVTCTSIYSPASVYRVLVFCAPWFLAYLAYLIVLTPALLGTSASGLLLKQGLFVTGFLCIAAYFSRASEPAGSLRIGALCGIALYLAFTEFSARLIGKSLFSAVADFLGSGSFNALIYGFFRPVFNSLETGTELAFVASLTNSIAVSLLVLSLCFRIGFKKPGIDVVGNMLTILTLFLCFLLNARSVALAAVVSIVLSLLIRIVAAKGVSLRELLTWCLMGVVFVAASLVAGVFGSSAIDSVMGVFKFSDSSADSRLEQYSWAFGLIEERLLLGHGYLENETGYPIHNLFLSSWAYAGIVGFIFATIFYVGLAFAWLRWLFQAVSKRGYWMLKVRLEWVAVLPVLPLFRVWISGAGGLPAYGEWIALGVFFGLVMRNESERARSSPDVTQGLGLPSRRYYGSRPKNFGTGEPNIAKLV